MKRISEYMQETGLEGIALDDMITCPNDGSEGAIWKVDKIDLEGNIHAKLIERKNASSHYAELGSDIIIAPEAWEKWEKIN